MVQIFVKKLELHIDILMMFVYNMYASLRSKKLNESKVH